MKRVADPPPAPDWVPAGVCYHLFPEAVRRLAERTIAPLYDELVVNGKNALERSAGQMHVELVFAELVRQFRLGQVLHTAFSPDVSETEFAKAERRYLNVVGKVQKSIAILLALRKYYQAPMSAYGDGNREVPDDPAYGEFDENRN